MAAGYLAKRGELMLSMQIEIRVTNPQSWICSSLRGCSHMRGRVW
jgi:hypothetical protein